MSLKLTIVCVLALMGVGTRAFAVEAASPVYIKAPIENEAVPVCLPDGSLKVFFISRPDGLKMCSIASVDQGMTWGERKEEFDLPAAGYHAVQVLVERGSGELVAFFHVFRGDPNGRKCGVDNFYDGWVSRTTEHRTVWTKPERVFEGYIGSIRGIIQTKEGRIIVPFGCEVPGKGPTLPTGSEVVTTMYSDDAGKTWNKSPSEIQAPCDPEYNNASWDGACEPSIVQLRDGRVWILMRTQANYLYETFSDDGIHFQPARRSRFFSPNAPSNMLRLKDGRIILIWNNTANPPKVNGQDVYGGRDALHIAISSDDGKTWKGFREFFRDPLANSAPPRRGDRGTSYATAIETQDGKLLIAAGLGEARHRIILLDPNWIEQTAAENHFANGLDDWSIFKWHGPVDNVWRDRSPGPELIADPDKPDQKVLHLRRPDEKDADGAVWNFPAGFKGEIKLRLMLELGGQGGSIALGDHFFDPTDVNGESKAMYYTHFYPDGEYCSGKLQPRQWNDVSLKWDTEKQFCEISIDGKHVLSLPQLESTRNGIGYLRLRSTAEKPDTNGFLVESVAANVEAVK